MERSGSARVNEVTKLSWQGKFTSVQPRIRLLRSFDQRCHNYLGYALTALGVICEEERELVVGIGKGAQAKCVFRAGDSVSGLCEVVQDSRLEAVEFYKISKLKVLERAAEARVEPPPWLGVPPDLETYRQRGQRRRDARTYEAKCLSCLWGCRMAVEMIIDRWNPSNRKYRQETFCYGPKSCSFHRVGPTRNRREDGKDRLKYPRLKPPADLQLESAFLRIAYRV